MEQSFPPLYIVHQGEMNTKICKKRSIPAKGLARPAFLHLKVQYLVATPVCQNQDAEWWVVSSTLEQRARPSLYF